MENPEKETELVHTSEQRKAKIKESIFNWLKDPYNLIFIIIFIALIALRFHYFLLTKNQPVWWDESEYLSAAKSYAGIVEYKLAEQRLPGYPILMSSFFIIGLTSESLLRFLFTFIPSILAILLLYFCVKEMYPNKKIALISLVIFGFLWEHIFYSNRFHTENLALIFEFLAILVLFKVYMKKENLYFIKPRYSLIWIALFCILAVLFRPGNLLFVPSIFIFFIFLNQSFFLEKKKRVYSIAGLIFLFILAVIFIVFLPDIPLLRRYYAPQFKISWITLTSFSVFYQSVVPWMPPIFYYAFLLGFFISLINTLIVIDRFRDIHRDSRNLEFKSDIYNLILIPTVLAVFIFLMRTEGFEPRWLFPYLPAFLAFTAKGIIIFSEFITGLVLDKKFAVFLIVLIAFLGLYNQWVHADSIIKMKLTSYLELKEAALWIKQNANQEDITITRSPHQVTFYSEKKIDSYGGMNETQFVDLIKRKHPKYVLEYVFEPGLPEFLTNPSPEMQKMLKPVNAWFLDKEKKQVVSIIYEIDYNAFNNMIQNTGKNATIVKKTTNEKNLTTNKTMQ